MDTFPSNDTPRQGPRPRQAVTLYDVAAHAGVKPMTVSRTLNGGNVSAALRESVLKAVEELGYQPNQAARSIKSGKSRQVGVLVRNNSRTKHEERKAHPLAYEFILGISEGLDEAGYLMSFVRLSDVEPEKHTQNSAFQGHLIDGLIVVNDVPAASPERLSQLVPQCVWVDSIWQPLNCIRRDEFHAGELTGGQVAAAGYREWLVALPQDALSEGQHYSAAARMNGLRQAADAAGATISTFELAHVRADFSALWPRLHRETALIPLDVYTASRVFYAANTVGRCAGHDFAVACPDDAGIMGWNTLARMHFDRFKFGLEAARLMIQLMENPDEAVASRLISSAWHPGPTLPPLAAL